MITIHLGDSVVGTLEQPGGSYSFEYTDEWLQRGFALGPDVPLNQGRHYSAEAFGFIEDASPDRWGRTIILRETRSRMKRQKLAPRALTSLDYFLGVSDVSRMGALRASRDGAFLAASDGVPPMIQLGRLLAASTKYQSGDYDDETIQLLLAPGSGLGGARPKASVKDAEGNLYIAKFPKNEDEYSVQRWEFIALSLACRAGCTVAEARLENIDEQPVLLSKRFDRDTNSRIHFSSAMNLLQLRDGDRSSYAEIADLMQRIGGDPTQLFRRMIVNILINNVDDHLRNHGFLRGRGGWELSPAYDINPNSKFEKSPVLSTAIVPDEFEANVDIALENCELFNLTSAQAARICEEVRSAVATWPKVARKAGATKREIEVVESAFTG
jgi:serine/threonine-protein kinase HipA